MVYIVSDSTKGHSQYEDTKGYKNGVARDKADVSATASTNQQKIDAHNIFYSSNIVRKNCKVNHGNTVSKCKNGIVNEEVTWEVFCVVADQVATKICSARN